MSQVTVTIAGKVYRMACGEGEERHLESLARVVDAKITEIHSSFGEIGDQRIIVMASLVFADELADARRRIAELEVDLVNLKHQTTDAHVQGDSLSREIGEALTGVASRIEAVTHRMNRARA